jgi:heme A synthase
MRFRTYAWGVLGVNLLVILWGAFVRASGSGAGCGRHWPLCNGTVLPADPGIATVIEFVHRASSGVALFLVVLLWWWSRRVFPRRHRVRGAASAALGFIVLEALIGAGLVLLELVGSNDSLARAGYLAAHLLNTFLLLGSLALTAHWAGAAAAGPLRGGDAAPRLLLAGLLLVLLVGMSGAVTALGDTLFPAESLREGWRADRASESHFLIRLRVIHPLLAVLTAGYLVAMVGLVRRARPAARPGTPLVLLVALQLAAGAANLLLLAPTVLQLTHLLLADLLWVAAVAFAAAALAAPVRVARGPRPALSWRALSRAGPDAGPAPEPER